MNPADYFALVIPGIRAPEYILNNADCQRIIRSFFEHDKPVVARLRFREVGQDL